MARYVLTHGEKDDQILANPPLTAKGQAEIRSLIPHLPVKPSIVICGTGQRHRDTLAAAGLETVVHEEWAGNGDQGTMVDGQKIVVLEDGTIVSVESYGPVFGLMAPIAIESLRELPDNSLVIGGRPIGLMLGLPQMKSATLYHYEFVDGQLQWKEVASA